MVDPDFPEERVVREERVIREDPMPVRRRRTVVERRSGGPRGGPSFGMNPIGAVIAGVLVIFILILIFGYLL